MKTSKDIAVCLAIAVLLFAASCGGPVESVDTSQSAPAEAPPDTTRGFDLPPGPPASPIPDLQAELLDERGKTTTSPIGNFDFKNFTYPLPRGWQHVDGDELILTNGKLEPVFQNIEEEMTPEEKAERRAARRIGMSYVTTKYLDANNDGADDAAVILKIETGGAAIPQLVYIYEWKDGQPSLLWNFRTGDRSDGGLKDLRMEDGELVVELYGQDRFLLGQTETGKITGDEEQLCCPDFFTRTRYAWNGADFRLQKQRLTYSIENPTEAPLENYGDIVNNPTKVASTDKRKSQNRER